MGQISFQQIFKVIAVFFLGYTVYSTERAIRHKQVKINICWPFFENIIQARHQFRRSAAINQSALASVQIQQESKPSRPDYERTYIVKVEPKEVVFPQDEQVNISEKSFYQLKNFFIFFRKEIPKNSENP